MTETNKILAIALAKAGAIIGLALLSKYMFDSELGNTVWVFLSGLL